MSIRRTVRQALATTLTAAGIAEVFQSVPIENYDGKFPIAVITLPQGREIRESIGKKRVDFVPIIQIWNVDYTGDPITAALNFDDLLDAIDTQIRSDTTLGGQVVAAGHEYINTEQPDPTLDEDTVIFAATKQLDLMLIFTG